MAVDYINTLEGVAFSSAANAKLTFTAAAKGAPATVAPTAPKLISDNTNSKGKIAIWGADNQFPQMIIDEVEKNVQSSALINWKTNALISGGLVYGTKKYDEKDGREYLVPARDPKVEAWLRRSNVGSYLRESAHEYHKFFNVWARMDMSIDGQSIAAISCMESAWCRWQVKNSKGVSENVYVHTNWAKNPVEDDENMMVLPAVDPYYDPVFQIRNNPKRFEKGFLFPICGVSSGKAYYQLHPWDSARKAGWLDQANSIPQYKNAVMKNQLAAYWHIEIPDWWWEWKFKDWAKKPELQAERQQKVIDDFNAKVTGIDAAGKTIMTIIKTDERSKKEYSGWKIHRLGADQKKDGLMIEDGQEASANIAFAHGVDYTLIGPAPGKGMGGGSGSDKRVAYNIYITISKVEQDDILKPIEFIFEFNKFNDPATGLPYDIWFKNYWVTTLDSGKETQQQAS